MTSAGKPDWERIESDYRAGVLSLREIAAKDGNVTEGAIRKRAKRDEWSRDLNAKILARADELVRKAAVRREVRGTQSANDREVIEANAERIAQVRGEHRADISRARALVLNLLGELEETTSNIDVFLELGELMVKADDKGLDKLNEAYRKAISRSERIGNVKALTEALKNLVGLEREAYGIDAKQQTPSEPPLPLAPTNEVARRIAYVLHRGVQAANDSKSPPRQAAS
jgi:hypothetical protein